MADQNTNTFIPHNSTQKPTTVRFGSVFLVAGLGFFIAAVVVAGMSYFARTALSTQLTSYQEGLERSRQRFNTGLSIRSIEQFDTRLRSVSEVLLKHKSFAGVFAMLERVTLKNVQLTSFSYLENDGARKNVIRLSARAPDYKTIAEMNEQFSLDEESRRYVTDVVFSGLSVDTKGTGLISFDIMFTIDPEFLSYNRYVNPESNLIDGNVVPSVRDGVDNVINQ